MAKSSKPAPPADVTAVADDFAGAEAIVSDGADGGTPVTVKRPKPAAGKAAGDAEKPPPFGTATPAGPGVVPRVVPELARAGDGEARYKVACRNYAPQKTRYVLAAAGDEAGAVACYLKVNGLDALLAKLRKQAGPKADDVEAPDLVVTELAD